MLICMSERESSIKRGESAKQPPSSVSRVTVYTRSILKPYSLAFNIRQASPMAYPELHFPEEVKSNERHITGRRKAN